MSPGQQNVLVSFVYQANHYRFVIILRIVCDHDFSRAHTCCLMTVIFSLYNLFGLPFQVKNWVKELKKMLGEDIALCIAGRYVFSFFFEW